jgi:hypothetical protein
MTDLQTTSEKGNHIHLYAESCVSFDNNAKHLPITSNVFWDQFITSWQIIIPMIGGYPFSVYRMHLCSINMLNALYWKTLLHNVVSSTPGLSSRYRPKTININHKSNC